MPSSHNTLDGIFSKANAGGDVFLRSSRPSVKNNEYLCTFLKTMTLKRFFNNLKKVRK